MKSKYVNTKILKEEANRHKSILEYKYYSDLSEDDSDKIDQLTMDDFQSADGAEGATPETAPAPEAGVAPEMGTEPEVGGEPENPFDDETPIDPEMDAGVDDTQEVDVTDIVNDTKEVNQKTDAITGKVDQTLQVVAQLMDKINSLEANVGGMSGALAKINSIYKDLELAKPPTPEEVKQATAANSYPFSVQLDDFGKEETPKNQTELEKKDNKLSLSNLLSDFNERDIRNSFNPPDPLEDRVSRALPAYRM